MRQPNKNLFRSGQPLQCYCFYFVERVLSVMYIRMMDFLFAAQCFECGPSQEHSHKAISAPVKIFENQRLYHVNLEVDVLTRICLRLLCQPMIFRVLWQRFSLVVVFFSRRSWSPQTLFSLLLFNQPNPMKCENFSYITIHNGVHSIRSCFVPFQRLL